MKQYIRTKDGNIYKTEQDFGICENAKLIAIFDFNGNYIDVQNNNTELKQADTIEELCDEFVVAYENGARIVYGDLEWAKVKAKTSLEVGYKSIIYGAIWTDKGLIFVAKMNNKGELVLL
jgi:hypothetical protein